MEIHVAPERILLFSDKLSLPDAQAISWEKRISSFGAVSKVASLWSAPKDSDFELTYQEHRYQPFWHVVATSKYVYDRTVDYQVPASGSEVKAITLHDQDYDNKSGHFHISVLEHCLTTEQEEVLVDGITGKNTPELSQYLKFSPKLITGPIEKSVAKNSILVPPQIRVSALMRDAISKMITGIQADKILEENVEVTCVDLYYHPIYAFQYRWISKNKEAIVEVDGLTGAVRSGSRIFSEYLGRVLDQSFLFDLGADAAGMFIPGGSIAVKVAKHYLDTKKKK